MIKDYLQIVKPGIIFGNLIAAAGGFFLAARGIINPTLLVATLFAVILIVASGCVFNNYIDRDIDSLMLRTCNRALVKGVIPLSTALIYGTILALVGFVLLYFATNLWAFGFAILGYFVYVVVYSLYLKRYSIHGTLIGSLSGAMPPVIGYCAAYGHFDRAALLLLIIFSLWQMPHSYAIAIFRYQDYVKANIPILPVINGLKNTRLQIVLYIIAFAVAALLLATFGYVGVGYFTVAIGLSIYWLTVAFSGYFVFDQVLWAKKVFGVSIAIIPLLTLMMAIDFTNNVPSSTLLTMNSFFNNALFN